MKLLVATEFPPDAPGGGPAVIRQMLKGFPGEVHWWSCRPSVQSSSFLVHGSESRLGGKSTEAAGSGWRVAGFEVASFACCPPGKLMPAEKLPRLKAWLMEHVWAPAAARSLRRAIERVKPDCIWAIPHDFSICPLKKILNDESRISDDKKMRVHVTIQDFPDCHGHGKLWGEKRVERMARMQEQIYAAADTCDATSHPMLEELEMRTGAKGVQMLHLGLEPEDFEYLQGLVQRFSCVVEKTKHQEPRTIKIAYAGTILCQREFALFVDLLKEARTKKQERRTPNLELHFYGAHSYAGRPWYDPEWMVEHGNLPERELVTALRGYDWGLIPMSLEDDDPRYNRFSFPTKFITYLAAGLPPIVMGHCESSVLKMAEQYQVGLRITDGRKGAGAFLVGDSPLSHAARSAFSPRSEFLPAVLRCARAEFDAQAMRERLWGHLMNRGVFT